MQVKSIVAAAILAVGTVSSFAADQSFDLSSGSASFIGNSPLLAGGDDVISFTNLAAGTYNFDFTLSSQYVSITSVMVNGQAASSTSFGNFKFFGLTSTDTSPFSVVINGNAGTKSLYSGELQVTAVPEPETYALMLAGLGAIGFLARRRQAGNAA